MLKETTIALAKVIEPVIAITVCKETVFRTFTMAGKEEIAFLTLLRQHLKLHL